MTRVVAGTDLAKRIALQLPGSVVTSNSNEVSVRNEALHDTLRLLRDDEDLDFQFLNSVSAVDYVEYFELVYHLTSLRRNTSCVVKSRLYSRDDPTAPSAIDLWRGAELQEREIYDFESSICVTCPERSVNYGISSRKDWSPDNFSYWHQIRKSDRSSCRSHEWQCSQTRLC